MTVAGIEKRVGGRLGLRPGLSTIIDLRKPMILLKNSNFCNDHNSQVVGQFE
jgi:hypothetical protein